MEYLGLSKEAKASSRGGLTFQQAYVSDGNHVAGLSSLHAPIS
jgi:hypothetical protein